MTTANEIAGIFDVTSNTIRGWTKEFADYLSPNANPKKGNPRNYNENDLMVLNLVARYRGENASYGDIHTALANGETGDLPTLENDRVPPENTNTNENIALAPVELLERFAERLTSQFQGQINALENERSHLRETIETERLARVEAVERATKAETISTMLQAQLDQVTSSPPPPPSSQDTTTDNPLPPTSRRTLRQWWRDTIG